MGIVSRSQGGSGVTKLAAAQLSRAVSVGGNITTANTAAVYVELAAATGGPGTGGMDLTIPAGAGDVLFVSGSIPAQNVTAVGIGVDIATWVAGAAVNWLGQSAGSSANAGLGFIASGVAEVLGIAIQYVVQAGDITGGNVVLRPHYEAGGVRVIARSVVTGSLNLSVANLLH